MSKLVFIENGKSVTDSLTIAEVFGKEHKHVLRDIETLECSAEFSRSNFGQSNYTNERGRTYPKYIITQDGFSFLVMGYTGKEAAGFKENYIREFNRIRNQLSQVPVLTERQAVIQSLKLAAELAEEMDGIKTTTFEHGSKLVELEHKVDNQITLDSGQQAKIQKAVKRRVCEFEEDKEVRKGLFSQLYREIYDRWGVPSYRDVLRKDLQNVIAYINAWVPRKA